MRTREDLYHLIDELPDEELAAAECLLECVRDAGTHSLLQSLVEEALMDEAWEDALAGGWPNEGRAGAGRVSQDRHEAGPGSCCDAAPAPLLHFPRRYRFAKDPENVRLPKFWEGLDV